MPNRPIAKWPKRELEAHRDMLVRRQNEIQGRIDALEMEIRKREQAASESDSKEDTT